MTPEEHINQIIENTFNVLSAIKNDEHQNSRLIFPKYRNQDTRYSEQELRFLFVEQFLQYCEKPENKECKDWLYSVETPTTYKYIFKNQNKPRKCKQGETGGESAQIDLVIHNKDNKRIALVEFKAHNTSPFKFKKDFVKLKGEPKKALKYFVMYIDTIGPSTISNLSVKFKKYINDSKILFFCYDIDTGKRVDSKILE